MDFEPIRHPFSPSGRGVCIFPVQKAGTDNTVFVPCGKMQSLHVGLILNQRGEVIQGNHLVAAAHALGLPLIYKVAEE